MPLDNPRAYLKGNGGGAVMLAAKGRMAEMLKKMMAAKLKAKLGYAMGEEGEMEEELKSGEMEMPKESPIPASLRCLKTRCESFSKCIQN